MDRELKQALKKIERLEVENSKLRALVELLETKEVEILEDK